MKKTNLTIANVTRMVGQTFLKDQKERSFPFNKLHMFSSIKPEDKQISFKGKQSAIVELV